MGASILAKVTRDRLMHSYDREWPMYALSKHKGYPTSEHVDAIAKHGPCPIHRRTFAPLKATSYPPATPKELKRVDRIRGVRWTTTVATKPTRPARKPHASKRGEDLA